jgi:hypothetical protein
LAAARARLRVFFARGTRHAFDGRMQLFVDLPALWTERAIAFRESDAAKRARELQLEDDEPATVHLPTKATIRLQ